MKTRDLMRRYGLNKRQATFVNEYLVDLNQTQGAIRAGYSPRTAAQQASRLLTHVNVKDALEAAFQERVERVEVDQEMVIARLARIAMTDIDTFVTWKDGRVKLIDLEEIPAEKLAIVAEVSETIHGLRVRLADRMPALTLLAKHLRLLPTPGSREEPLHHEVTMKEDDLDLTKLTPAQLQQYQGAISALLQVEQILSGGEGAEA